MIDKLLQIAAAEIGTAESPKGSNNVKYNMEQGFAAAAWFCAFVRWCFNKAGLFELWKSSIEWEEVKTAYCPYVVSSAKHAGQWVTSGYRRGDVVLFTTNGNSASHIGIIESVTIDGKSFVSIEGNTSDVVARRTHNVDKTVLGAFRPKCRTRNRRSKRLWTSSRKRGSSMILTTGSAATMSCRTLTS